MSSRLGFVVAALLAGPPCAVVQAGDYVVGGVEISSPYAERYSSYDYYLPEYVLTADRHRAFVRPRDHHDVRPLYDGYGDYVVYPTYYAPSHSIRVQVAGDRSCYPRHYERRTVRSYRRHDAYGGDRGYRGHARHYGSYSDRHYRSFPRRDGRSLHFSFRRGHDRFGFHGYRNRGHHYRRGGFSFSRCR